MGAHQQEIVSAADASVAVTSMPVCSRGCVKAAFQNSWTGTVTGTFAYQGSNHRLAMMDPTNPRVVWTPLTVALIHGTAAPAGAPGNNLAVITNLPYAIRYVFTPSAGAGTLTTQLDLDDVVD